MSILGPFVVQPENQPEQPQKEMRAVNAFTTFIHRVKDLAVQAWNFVRGKVAHVVRAVRSSRPGQVVATKVSAVRAHPTTVSIVTKASTLLGSLGRKFVGVAVVDLALRAIVHWRDIPLLWRDWRNNHRRVAGFLWETALGTGMVVYYSLLWKVALPLLAVAGVVTMASVAYDYFLMASRGIGYAEEHTGETYMTARAVVALMAYVFFYGPYKVMQWKPEWLRNFLVPTPRKGRVVQGTVTINQDRGTTVYDSVNPTSVVPDDASEVYAVHVDPEPSQQLTVNIDGDLFKQDPRHAGADLAGYLFLHGGREAVVKYRKGLAKILRSAGLTDREVTFSLQAYDTFDAATV